MAQAPAIGIDLGACLVRAVPAAQALWAIQKRKD